MSIKLVNISGVSKTGLIRGCIFMLFSVLMTAAMAQPHYVMHPKLIGAELYSSTYGNGKCKIYLKAFYEADTIALPKVENVSIFESELKNLNRTLELKTDTIISGGSVTPVTCGPVKSNKLRIVIYSGDIDFGHAYANYDITWGYCCFQQDISNIEIVMRTATTLSIHLDNPVKREAVNSMPTIENISTHLGCGKTSSEVSLKATDADSDMVSYSLVSPMSYETADHKKYTYPETKIPNSNIVMRDPMFEGSFLTVHPPFTALTYKKEYSSGNQVKAAKFSLDQKTGKLSYNSAEKGKYLISISIIDSKNNTQKSTHQAFFILEII
jgi:hypothetical protein